MIYCICIYLLYIYIYIYSKYIILLYFLVALDPTTKNQPWSRRSRSLRRKWPSLGNAKCGSVASVPSARRMSLKRRWRRGGFGGWMWMVPIGAWESWCTTHWMEYEWDFNDGSWVNMMKHQSWPLKPGLALGKLILSHCHVQPRPLFDWIEWSFDCAASLVESVFFLE